MFSERNVASRAVAAACVLVSCIGTAWSAERMEFVIPGPTSRIAVPNETVIANTNNPFRQPSYAFQATQTRTHGWGDFNGDGLNDIFVAPSYFGWKPELPLQIWGNNGDGTFSNRTADFLVGTPPKTGSANNVFVNDFNNDGRADIFVVDQGLEDIDPYTVGYDGHINTLLLSEADGKLHDRSSTLPGNAAPLPGQAVTFNHFSNMADVNGDGNQDIVMTTLAGPRSGPGGIYFYLSDGKGAFTRTTQGIPADIAFPTLNNNTSRDWHYPGSSTVCDLDGDGRGDLTTGSYGNPDAIDKKRNVRFHQQQADGTFVEKRRIPIPAVLEANSAPVSTVNALGVYQVACGKLTGGAFNDVMVVWESRSGTFPVLYRNDGNFNFTDITLSTFGSYDGTLQHTTQGQVTVNEITVMDVDGDGFDDLWYRTSNGTEAATMTERTGYIYLNDGRGNFSPFRLAANGRQLTKAEAIAALGNCAGCDYSTLIFDAGGSTQNDLVVINGRGDLIFTPTVVQAKAVDITTFINTAPARNVLKPGVLFSSGQASSRSYVRLNNTGTTPGTATITLADATSGRTFTKWTSPTVPAGASAQYFVQDIETAINPAVARPPYFSATVTPSFDGTFQHVLWRPTDGTLTNLSTCGATVTATPTQLINVHSTLLGSGYTSSVVIANTGTTSQSAQLGIYDSVNGTKLGTYTSSVIAPGNQSIVEMGVIEAAANVNPGTTRYHFNIKLEGGLTSGFLQHLVNNTKVGVITDMSTVCKMGTTTAATEAPTVVKQPALFSSAQASSRSYVRFNNTGATAGTATVTLTNGTTGQTYATWTSPSIAAGASEQFFIETLENAGAPGAQRPAFFGMSARATFDGAVQHVLWRPADGTLTNLSTCETGVNANATQLINVHSSLLESAYPSSVVIANTGTTATAARLGLYNATTGQKLGTFNSASIPAGGQAVIAVSAMEAAASVSPGNTIYHYNVKVESTLNGFLQHLVTNKQAGVVTDMTTTCQVAKS